MFESICRWLGVSMATARTVRPMRAPVFEPLEHRLLRDAAPAVIGLVPAPPPTNPAQSIVEANDDSGFPNAIQGVGWGSQPPTYAAGDPDPSPLPASGTAAQAQRAAEFLDLSPALFVENQGQWSDASVRYVHDSRCVDVAATDQGMVFQIARTRTVDTEVRRFSASFVGARPVEPVGLARSATAINYFVGDPSLWRPNVPAYEQVVYKGLYDGVDLYIQGLDSHLKYEFHVAPGANWSQVSIRYDGLAGLTLAGDGALVLDLGEGWGALVDDRPYIYQVVDGRRVAVAGSFRLLDNYTCAFEATGPYDPARELVIDPNLVWSTYLGGSGGDWAYGVALDPAGNVYVTGQTQSSDWDIGDSGTVFQGVADAFVAKLGPTGAGLWRAYLGGTRDDRGWAVALDSGGNVYVTGQTDSPGWVGNNGFDPTYNGAADAFVSKLSPAGAMLWSSYIGGAGGDWGYGLAVDPSDNLYVTGQTESADNWTFGGFDMTFNGASDAFVVKVNPAGGYLWGAYVGGPDRDWGYGVAVDSAGNVYVTGATLSAVWVSAGYDPTHDGGPDAFVAQLTAAGDASLWSTCLGGRSDDYGQDIAVDAFGNVYVTGATLSADWTSAGFDPTHKDVPDVLVAKLDAAGASLWSTWLGGEKGDWGAGVAVDAAGNVYVAGTTESSDWTGGGFDTTYHGGASDAFVAQLDAAGGAVWSSYLGGSAADFGYALAVDPSGYLYIAGQTESAGWTSGGFDPAYAGSGDAFVAKVSFGRLVPVHRFWSASLGNHFYTTKEGEKDKLINQYADIWAYEGPAYRAFADAAQPGVAPIYRFWSASLGTHFYTIKEGEKNKLIRDYSTVWAFEGVAFYGYAATVPAAGTYPIYRFWSESLGAHFYTIKEGEKNKLIDLYSAIWTFEGVAWYDLLILA